MTTATPAVALEYVRYEFNVIGAPDVSSRYSSGRGYTIRPRTVTLISCDGGRTIRYAHIEGNRVRRSDGELGSYLGIIVGPGYEDAVPSYVPDMLTLLHVKWSTGGAR
jgi:hypothetical protein